MKRNTIIDLIVALLILLFAYTASSKLLNYDTYVFQMMLAPLPVMKIVAPFLGWIIPSMEIIVVIGLLLPRTRLTALYLSLLLFIAFEVYITAMLLSGLRLPCTCGGFIAKMSWKQHLLFNAFFIVITTTAIWLTKKNKAADMPPNHIKNLSRA